MMELESLESKKKICNEYTHFQLFLCVLPVVVVYIDSPSLVLLMLGQYVCGLHLKIPINLIASLWNTQLKALFRKQSIQERFFMPENPSIVTPDTA